jgi:drug/metabolite transporter (DMT)-like permease
VIRSIILILIAIGLGIGGLLLWRSAIEDAGGFRLSLDVMGKQLLAIAGSWKFWVGGFLLLGVVLVSLELYGNEELSRIVPMYSLSYVVLALVGKFFLGEQVGPMRWAGIVVILTGVALLSRS